MKTNSDIMSRAISDSELEQLVFFLSELVYSSNDCTKTTCRMSFAGKSLHWFKVKQPIFNPNSGRRCTNTISKCSSGLFDQTEPIISLNFTYHTGWKKTPVELIIDKKMKVTYSHYHQVHTKCTKQGVTGKTLYWTILRHKINILFIVVHINTNFFLSCYIDTFRSHQFPSSYVVEI